ncbi:MAG: hypothetical protein COW24_03180 [Candidatus Kerfeldbacteria bacterium CG15_BIG_FIL_POST_REV_8_21_14_020_45_12]|uniref:Uncharacterized protein n=1 Tax=Candidatus Kerfeldbacteria bacterium CG15_BIG_FIL_POST_REV_8_21_14_020_45_12 TaxID=2014247 RepID=A0A2M7H3X5_9BACT|nr:MAG: hypothetical protein COW24_03180 [Candidatus Kerfeldbacteria bacterium CG15_BIG_FIL_POST_REV_8_21_14_020_45_12]PJA92765.1 MAG: hypothetical protein CO132_06270 [Candidatus Kerfeldbacteria bacterium CG_4_9_14_3_um_filter_45_8]
MAFRVRKEGGVGSSIAGMLFGILMIVFGAPIAAWYAESQHSAEDFTSATVVESNTEAEGYIVVKDIAVSQDDLLCPYLGLNGYVADASDVEESGSGESDVAVVSENESAIPAQDSNKSCLYVSTTQEQYERSEYEHCGKLSNDQTVIRQLDDVCDSNGTNCESCYLVEEYDWSDVDEGVRTDFGAFTLGDYNIDPEDTPRFIGLEKLVEYEFLESKNDPVEGDFRWSYEFFPTDQDVLVAGSSEKNEIRGAYDGKPFVISNLAYQGTLEAMQQKDKTAKWGLRILSLGFMVFGMILVTGPLTMFTNIFRAIPMVGKYMDKGLDAVVGFIAAIMGFFFWVILYGIVLVLKNIVAIIIVLALIGVAIFFLAKRGKKEDGGIPPASPPQTPVSS